jgi:hypothetical protein
MLHLQQVQLKGKYPGTDFFRMDFLVPIFLPHLITGIHHQEAISKSLLMGLTKLQILHLHQNLTKEQTTPIMMEPSLF